MKIAIGKNIRIYRKAAGLTQEQLAEAVGVTVGAVSGNLKFPQVKDTTPQLTLALPVFAIYSKSIIDYKLHHEKVLSFLF